VFIRPKKFTKKEARPSNEITEDDINYFLDTIKDVGQYPKVRDLRKLLPTLNPIKINTILRYLERSGRLQNDLNGNIIWIRQDKNEANQLTLAEAANISKEFLEYFSTKNQDVAKK
jgi:hypothetical protein